MENEIVRNRKYVTPRQERYSYAPKSKLPCNVNKNVREWTNGRVERMASFSVFAIRSKFTKLLLSVILLLVFYFEFASYWTLPWTWMEQPDCRAPHCKKLLLVSDPQIIGSEWKRIFLLDVLAIWDSDRYLKKTFEQAVNFVKPDIIIFLGDLMDQGHTATDPEFQTYMRRLKQLFELPNSLRSTKVIISPGDNDIGGIEDILVPANVHRFDKMFNQTEECELIEFIEFCKVNLMTSVMQNSKFISSNLIRVALSHVPLTPKQTYFLNEVVKKIRPNLIFSGHVHTSSHYTASENDVWNFKHSSITPQETQLRTYKFHEGFLHEIIVPTCSYRMGVYNMGYGAAYIDTKRQLVQYNVLWLPHRYNQMVIYLVVLLIAAAVMLCRKARRYKQVPTRNLSKLYSSPA